MNLTYKTQKTLSSILTNHLYLNPEDEEIKEILNNINKSEPLIDLLKEGKEILCMVGDDEDSLINLEKITAFEEGYTYPFQTSNGSYKHARHATIEDLKDYLAEEF